MILRLIISFLFAAILFQPAFSQDAKIKNVIFFIGDGMHLEHEIAASKYLTGFEKALSWHDYPYQAFMSTWDINTYNKHALNNGKSAFTYGNFYPSIGYNPEIGGKSPYPISKEINHDYFLKELEGESQVGYTAAATDSAAAATAFATGLKTVSGNISWLPGDLENGKIKTIMELAREQKGMSIGVVTTVPFNHATPAAFVSHNISRKNYYTGKEDCDKTGIATEIISVTKPDVVIGGGHPKYTRELFFEQETFISQEIYEKLKKADKYVFVERQDGIPAEKSLPHAAQKAIKESKKLLGLFGGPEGCMNYKHNMENPALSDSVKAALAVLSQNPKGFILMAEQGNIDWSNHQNNYKRMIWTMADLNDAVKAAQEFVDKPGDDIDWNNTILIVTSDHANSYMRIKKHKNLNQGVLPAQINFLKIKFYPGGEIKYSTNNHTNELVTFYAKGNSLQLFKEKEAAWYPGTKIFDNTHVFDVLIETLGINYDKNSILKEDNYELTDF